MPEISARDLRRLSTLEARLEKTREERSSLAAERRELRRLVTAAERAASAAEERITALLEENRRLAGELSNATGDAEQLRKAALEAREEIIEARRKLREAETARRQAERRVGTLEKERERLADQLKVAEAQIRGKPARLLAASEAAGLVGRLIDDLEGGLSGAAVREGELRLKVAFGKVGRTSGLVLPTPETAEELDGVLQDVSIRFDRADARERQQER